MPAAMFILRLILQILFNPYVAYGVYFIAVASFMLAPPSAGATLSYAMLAPWILLALFLLNIPFVGAAFRKFRLNEAEKRNHALEHGTIFFLNKLYARRQGVSGRATEKGFRLSGVRGKAEVQEAFSCFVEASKKGKEEGVVSARCGSMIIAAQGLGVLLLTLSLGAAVVFHPGQASSGLLLAANLLLFLLLRYPIGLWFQRRFLLSLDFSEAQISDIKPVRKQKLFERPQVVFVSTRIH